MDIKGPRAEIIEKWLHNIGLRRCSVCGDAHRGFTTQDVSAIIQTGEAPLTEASVSPGVPVVPVICNNCGNTMLLHAGLLGIV